MRRDNGCDRVVATIAAVLSVGLAVSGLAACRGGKGSPAATTSVATAVTPAPTTTSTAPPTTTFQPTAPQPSAGQAGAHLVAAWMKGDRVAALTDATPTAVESVFSQPYPAGGVQDRQCAAAVAGPSTCVYRLLASGGLLSLSAVAVTGGWAISGAVFQS